MRNIENCCLERFKEHLSVNEKSYVTIEKYVRDVKVFVAFAKGKPTDKSTVIEYKEYLSKHYKISSANSMLAALNAFLKFLDLSDLCIKRFKMQKSVFCNENKELNKEEYFRLCKAAESEKNRRLQLVIQTLGSTGIRISELAFITVETVKSGEATVSCKGKTRKVFIVKELRNKLLNYCRDNGILSGCIFITRSGTPLNRSNIWREMKRLCKKAGVEPQKVFPHNLRHLFAKVFYSIEKDLAKLADILGHSSIDTTRIYIISSGNEHRRLMENMCLLN